MNDRLRDLTEQYRRQYRADREQEAADRVRDMWELEAARDLRKRVAYHVAVHVQESAPRVRVEVVQAAEPPLVEHLAVKVLEHYHHYFDAVRRGLPLPPPPDGCRLVASVAVSAASYGVRKVSVVLL